MEEIEKLRASNVKLTSSVDALKIERDSSLAKCVETDKKKDKLEDENKKMKAEIEKLRPKADKRDYFFRELQAEKRSVGLLKDVLEKKVSDQKTEQTKHAKTLQEKGKKITTQQGKITNLQTSVNELEKENKANKNDKQFQKKNGNGVRGLQKGKGRRNILQKAL